MSIPAQGAETMTAGQSLDLRDLHAANIARQAEWCPDQVPDLSFRGNELGGECGEAQNVIKKLERERQGWRGSRATKDDLADELADVVICADLCAVTADIDLGAAVRRKFNATSEKQGLSVFLPLPALASPRADSDERTAGVLWSAWPEDDCDSDPRIDPMAQKVTEWFVGRWPVGAEEPKCRILIGAGRSAEIIARRIAEKLTSILNTDAIVARKSATPAQPAGAVPDGLRFGEGKLVVDVGTYGERPAVFIKPVEVAGPIGELAADQGDLTRLEHGEQVLTFPTMEQARAVRDAMLGRATPSQPAGAVPDGLRALLDEIDAVAGDIVAPGFKEPEARNASYQWCERLRHRLVTCTVALEKLLASHPAGQSAGSGAEDAGLKDAIAEIVRRAEKDQTFLRRTLARMRAEQEPAPDSTRTGQGEETVAVPASALRWLFGDGPDADGVWFGDQIRGKGAFWWRSEFRKRIEAARPADPEAQGAERVRHVRRGTEYEVLGYAEGQISTGKPIEYGPNRGNVYREVVEDDLIAVYRGEDGKLWWRFPDEFRDGRFVSAPPASSGQGGR